MSEGAAPAKSSHGQQLTRQQKAAAVIVSLGTVNCQTKCNRS